MYWKNLKRSILMFALLPLTAYTICHETTFENINIDSIVSKAVSKQLEQETIDLKVNSIVNERLESYIVEQRKRYLFIFVFVLFVLIVFGCVVPMVNNRQREKAYEELIVKMLSQIRFKEDIVDTEDKLSKLMSQALNEKDVDKQIDMFTHILNISPKNITALNGRSLAFLSKNDFENALKDIGFAIELDSLFDFLYITRGLIYYMSKTYDKAIVDLNKAIELNPYCEYTYWFRGNIFYDTKEHDKAMADYNKSIELRPDFAEAYNSRGYAYGIDYEKSLADYNKAIELKPDMSIAYNNRGWVYNQKGNYDLAIVDFNKAIELDPENPNPYNHRGFAYLKKKMYDNSITDYNKAIELKPEYAEAYYNRSLYYAIKDDFRNAFENLSKGLELAKEQCDDDLSDKIEKKMTEVKEKLKK